MPKKKTNSSKIKKVFTVKSSKTPPKNYIYIIFVCLIVYYLIKSKAQRQREEKEREEKQREEKQREEKQRQLEQPKNNKNYLFSIFIIVLLFGILLLILRFVQQGQIGQVQQGQIGLVQLGQVKYCENDEEFNLIMDDAKKERIPVVIFFSATWCVPCRAFKPDFEKLAASEDYGGSILFVEVDVDECPETVEKLEAFALPTIVLINSNGEEDKQKRIAKTKIDQAVFEEKILSTLTQKQIDNLISLEDKVLYTKLKNKTEQERNYMNRVLTDELKMLNNKKIQGYRERINNLNRLKRNIQMLMPARRMIRRQTSSQQPDINQIDD